MDAVIKHLQECLANCKELTALSTFDPLKLPSRNDVKEAFDSWGRDEMAVLEKVYGDGDNPDVSVSSLRSEWESFKHLIFQQVIQVKNSWGCRQLYCVLHEQ